MEKKYKKHLIVVGSARSGTSWLAETIAAQNRYRLLFEPEHEFNTKEGKVICDKYINHGNSSPEIENYLKKVFSNLVDNDWIAQCSNRRFKQHLWPLLPKKYIIKFVRANLGAHYMNEKFEIPLVHLIRDPFEVLFSQQRVKFPWLYDLSHFQDQEELVEMVFSNFGFHLGETNNFSALEALAVRWCLENIVPLEVQKKYSYKAKIVRHEELRNDINLFYELCNFFGLQPISNLESRYKIPSSKTHPQSQVRSGASDSGKFSNSQIQTINKILDIFGCDLYPRRN